ncbi:MAG: prepilin-type N-terminal cleavage/methylation domain-containing protein, partial [Candidatus Hydrogenedentes bacterium]|nr:prepilin-type N-terminal cleavage/methylation domain-containing protein [Candidatus Hydrogenedentota bacterium]
MSRFRRANGVTLVELMVALAVFSTVMAGISVVFISSMRAWRTGRESRSVFEMARAAVQFMERDITSAFGSVDRDEFRTLVGTSDWLTFVEITENPVTWRELPSGGGYDVAHSDMSRITYFLAADPAVPDEHLLLRLVQLDVDELRGYPRPEVVIPRTVAAWNRIIEDGNPE